MWRAIVIEWPATIVTLWWRIYWLIVLTLLTISATVSLTALVLNLAFGIRWGW